MRGGEAAAHHNPILINLPSLITLNDMEQDQQFLDYVIKALVDNPSAVVINRSVDEMGVLLTLSVHADDMGKIIGRDGNIAKALRTLLRVVGMKHNARVNLKINEPTGGKHAGSDDRQEKTVDQVVEELG
jgi:predicted RNA-binding protein YlqC (UPF0109 family)